MDVFFYSVTIVACILFIKVIIIICVYMCRARKLRLRQLAERQAAAQSGGRDASLYPANNYNQHSPFVNFEEVPQPVITVAPGETPQSLLPEMLPPPYTLAVSGQQKPPAYDDIYKDSLEGTSSATLGTVDAGQECTAPQTSTPSSVPSPASTPGDGVTTGQPNQNSRAGDDSSSDENEEDICIEENGTEEAQIANSEAFENLRIVLDDAQVDEHATVSPGGGIAIV